MQLDRQPTAFELVCALLTPLYAARAAEEVLFGADAASLSTVKEVRSLMRRVACEAGEEKRCASLVRATPLDCHRLLEWVSWTAS